MLPLQVLGVSVHIDCADVSMRKILLANFAALRAPATAGARHLSYTLARDRRSDRYLLRGPGPTGKACVGSGDALFRLEKGITVALQRQRRDLLFLHAAALERGGKVWLLVGDSGRGKSTTAWGLLHHGFGYLSDELAPIDLPGLQVLAYPHALCLKRRPPGPYPWPQAHALDLGATLHVPTYALPAPPVTAPCPLAGLLFVRHRPNLDEPALRAIARSEAAARLYASALNALAHPGLGLDAAVRIAERVPAFVLEAARLEPTCELVAGMVGGGQAPSIIGHGPADPFQRPPRLRSRRAARRRLVLAGAG